MFHLNNATWNVAYHLLTTYIAFNASKKIHCPHLLTILTNSRFRFYSFLREFQGANLNILLLLIFLNNIKVFIRFLEPLFFHLSHAGARVFKLI